VVGFWWYKTNINTKITIMGYMSYCKFEMTAQELSNCLDAIIEGDINELSYEEIYGLRSILQMAEEIVDMKDDIKEGIEQSKKYNEEE
jgi:predicted oxidoreductase